MSYFTWTGNPWVDGGMSAMLGWTKKKEPKDITIREAEKIVDELEHLYMTDGWRKTLFSVFPNNPVKKPAVKNKWSKLKELLDELIKGFEPMGNAGKCIACGIKNCNQQRTCRDIPLTGYGGSHFFLYKADRADYCNVCSFAEQCVPLVLYRCGNLALIHSNSTKVLHYWARKYIEQVRRLILKKEYTGCFNEEFKNPMNALLHIIQDLVLQYDERWAEENASVRIYHFTNYNQGAELAFYDLPMTVFRFLANIRRHSKYPDWISVVRKCYRYNIMDKEISEYKNFPNEVYQRLLSNESILRYFLDFGNKLAQGNWALLSLYLKEIKNMDKKRIDSIRIVANEISELIKTSAHLKKRLNQFEMANYYNWFGNIVLRLVKDQIAQGKSKPLFTFEEYVEQLFPDGALGWKETQDLILFRIYEELHFWLIQQGVAEELKEDE